MKICFADFDGVLNSHAFMMNKERREQGGVMGLDPSAVLRLNRLLKEAEAEVVVSSSWRHGRTRLGLYNVLVEAGFVGTVRGKTPDYVPNPNPLSKRHVGERGDEIQAWLNDAPRYGIDVESFVILDDDSDMSHLVDRLVKTEFAHGLLDEHVERAVEMLNRPLPLIVEPTTEDVRRLKFT